MEDKQKIGIKMTLHKLKWCRSLEIPFISPRPGSCASEAVTTPQLLLKENNSFQVFLGAVNNSLEKIITFPILAVQVLDRKPLTIPNEARILIEAEPVTHEHYFDPAALLIDEEIYLYYSRLSSDEESIGLISSMDGVNFLGHGYRVLAGRSPEIVIKDGDFHLFYVRKMPTGGYAIFLAKSKDGRNFHPQSDIPVLSIGPYGDWDGLEVTTPRITKISDYYYMMYAGSGIQKYRDVPQGFGLARSTDLVHWDKYPYNPVFERGVEGTWDDGAIWFGSIVMIDDVMFLIYEGGRLENIINKTPSLTQVGLGEISTEEFMDGISSWN